MKMKRSNKKTLSLFLCIVLIVAMALFTTGCNDNNVSEDSRSKVETGLDVYTDITVLGEGEKKFAFVVVDSEENETVFAIQTDKETVGEALLELELISGEKGDYGLYVKTVNGITADYDKDGTYWAFYINDEYATSGVDKTTIVEGDIYTFKVQK